MECDREAPYLFIRSMKYCRRYMQVLSWFGLFLEGLGYFLNDFKITNANAGVFSHLGRLLDANSSNTMKITHVSVECVKMSHLSSQVKKIKHLMPVCSPGFHSAVRQPLTVVKVCPWTHHTHTLFGFHVINHRGRVMFEILGKEGFTDALGPIQIKTTTC